MPRKNKRINQKLKPERLFADVTSEDGKVHTVSQKKLPQLVPDGRKHMLKLRRQRQLSRTSDNFFLTENQKKEERRQAKRIIKDEISES